MVLGKLGLNGTWEALRLKILQVLEAAMLCNSYYSIIVPRVPGGLKGLKHHVNAVVNEASKLPQIKLKVALLSSESCRGRP